MLAEDFPIGGELAGEVECVAVERVETRDEGGDQLVDRHQPAGAEREALDDLRVIEGVVLKAPARDPGERAPGILERTALHRLPRVAAASPGTITSRDGAGCRIRLQESRAEPDQTYVIIEVADAAGLSPAHMFIVDAGGQCRKFALPEARNGVIQFLVERQSDLLAGLLDIKTEVFLK